MIFLRQCPNVSSLEFRRCRKFPAAHFSSKLITSLFFGRFDCMRLERRDAQNREHRPLLGWTPEGRRSAVSFPFSSQNLVIGPTRLRRYLTRERKILNLALAEISIPAFWHWYQVDLNTFSRCSQLLEENSSPLEKFSSWIANRSFCLVAEWLNSYLNNSISFSARYLRWLNFYYGVSKQC